MAGLYIAATGSSGIQVPNLQKEGPGRRDKRARLPSISINSNKQLVGVVSAYLPLKASRYSRSTLRCVWPPKPFSYAGNIVIVVLLSRVALCFLFTKALAQRCGSAV